MRDYLSTSTAGQLVLLVYDNDWVRGVLALLLANVILGIAVSLYNWHDPIKRFYLGNIGDWVFTRAVPLLMGGGVVQLLVYVALPPAWGMQLDLVSAGVWSFIILQLVSKIFENLHALGFHIPPVLGSRSIPPDNPNR